MNRFFRRLTAFILAMMLLSSFCTVSAWDLPVADSPEFEELFPIPSFLPQPEEYVSEEDTSNTSLAGKSILFFGDSYTMGYGLEDFSQSWCAMLETEYNMDVTCYSIHGSTMGTGFLPFYCVGGSFMPISTRPLPVGDFDIVFVSAGSNDWFCQSPLYDKPDSRNLGTYVGAINATIDRLETAYPNATIVFMTPWLSKGTENLRGETTNDYSQMMSYICDLRDIPCFEAYRPENSTMFTDSEDFRAKYFLTSSDSWHLNASGHQRFLPVIADWLIEILQTRSASLTAQEQIPNTV